MSEGPKPFSSDWYREPDAPESPPQRFPQRARRKLIGFGSRLPSERTLSILTVFVLVFSSFWFAGPQGDAQVPVGDAVTDGALETPIPANEFNLPEPTASSSISTDTLEVSESDSDQVASIADGPAKTAPQLNLQAPAQPTTTDGLLPGHRIIAFYGFPGNDEMGILGENDMDQVLALLKEQAAAYEEADPTTPVLIAFEVIASVGQKEPMADGSYLLDAPTELLDSYADFCEKNDLLLFLDVQIGRRKVADEIKGLERWLKKPFVHLALDPEFAMREGQIPGEDIGQIDASDVTLTQNWLVDLTQRNALPPKVLIVHQFHDGMIENKDKIAPVAGVQLVIDADGWGPPEQKRSTYAFVNGAQEIEYDGIKLFYKQDDPIMSPSEVVELTPVPMVVIYQ